MAGSHYKITEIYGCGHYYDIITRCKDTYSSCHTSSNHEQFSTKKPAKESIFSKMFRSSSRQKEELPARFKHIDDVCQQCKRRDAEKRDRNGSPQRAPYNLAEVRAQQVARATKAIRAGKGQFRCSKCKAEGRASVYYAVRAANNGLCCDNGRQEWEAAEKLAGSRSVRNELSPSNGRSFPARANSQLERRVHSPTTAAARQAAKQAAQGYGWSRDQAITDHAHTEGQERHVTAVGYDPRRARNQAWNRNSTHLEPNVARDFASIPEYALPSPPTQRTEQGTWYKEPGIDFDRWNTHPRTNHGRIPLAPQTTLPPSPPSWTERQGRDLLQRKPLPQTFRSGNWPSQSSGSSRESSLQQTLSRHTAKPLPRTPHRDPPPRSNIFPPTPATTHSFSSQAQHSSHASSSQRQQSPTPKPHLTAKSAASRHSLRSRRGQGWYDAGDLATKSPPFTPLTNTRPHASRHQEARLQEQDITSVSRLNGPFSPPELSWDAEDDEEGLRVKPLSFGGKSQSHAPQNSSGSRELGSRGQQAKMGDLLEDTLRAAEYWGLDLRGSPSRRGRLTQARGQRQDNHFEPNASITF